MARSPRTGFRFMVGSYAAFLVCAGITYLMVRASMPLPVARRMQTADIRIGPAGTDPISWVAAARGAVYIASRFSPAVYKLDSSGTVVAEWPANPYNPRHDLSAAPAGLATDPDGSVKVVVSSPPSAPTPTGYVVTFNPEGKVLGRVTCDLMTDSIAVGPDGRTYLKGGTAGLREIDASGLVVRQLSGGTPASAAAESPDADLAGRLVGAAADGSVYLFAGNTLRQVRPDGRAGWTLGQIRAAGTSPGGALYALRAGTERAGDEFLRCDARGDIRGRWRCARISVPECLAPDGRGHIYLQEQPSELAVYGLPGDRPDPPNAIARAPGTQVRQKRPTLRARRLGTSILRRAFARLHSAHSFTGQLTVRTVNWNFPEGVKGTGTVAGMKPRYFGLVIRSAAAGDSVHVADGKNLYSQAVDSEGQHIFLKRPLPKIMQSLPGLWRGEADAFFGGEQALAKGQPAWIGTATIDGEVCDRVRVSYPASNRTVVYFVGKTGGLLRRIDVQDVTPYGRSTQSNRFSDFRLDAPLTPERFRFQAPPGVKVVRSQ